MYLPRFTRPDTAEYDALRVGRRAALVLVTQELATTGKAPANLFVAAGPDPRWPGDLVATFDLMEQDQRAALPYVLRQQAAQLLECHESQLYVELPACFANESMVSVKEPFWLYYTPF